MKQYRSSVTGKYVSKEFAEAHPKTTVSEAREASRAGPEVSKGAVQEREAEEVPVREEALSGEEVRQAWPKEEEEWF